MSKYGRHYREMLERHQDADLKRLERDIKWLLDSSAGRRILLWLNSITGIYQQSTLEHLEYQCGKRDIGLQILAKANEVAPSKVSQAIAERSLEVAERNEELRIAMEQDNFEKGTKNE